MLALAEDDGVVRYASDGVAFIGRDANLMVRSVTVRYYLPKATLDGAWLTKRDMRHSDKSFPVVLRGDPCRVVIAEGAVTALAAQ